MGRGDREEEELVPLGVSSPEPEPPAGSLRKGLAIGALVAVLVGIGALASPGKDEPQPVGEVTTTTTAVATDDEPAPPGWRRGAPGPLLHRDHAAQVWTGTELVIWGGDPDGDSGAAYEPGRDRWRRLPAAPIPARCQGTSTWTGREVLVWGPACTVPAGHEPWATAAAAYDPAADRWRAIPNGPVVGTQMAASVWTGTEWIVVNSAGPTGAFEPGTGTWRELAPVPHSPTTVTAQWTGHEVVVLLTEITGKGPSGGGAHVAHRAAALDPAAGRWRDLPPPPLELGATAVWDGERIIAWDQNLHAAALDPAGGGWRSLADLPVDFTDCQPVGVRLAAVVFAEHCGQGALWRPWDETWEHIPHPHSLAELPVWTGEEALFWVGRFAGSGDGVWFFRPPDAAAAGADGRHRRPVPMGGANPG